MMSPTHYAADELACSSRHSTDYQTLVKDKEYSAEYIACKGAAFGEEALAAEVLRTMHPNRFTKRDALAQMDKYHIQEQAHYLYARLSQDAVAADLVLCMCAKGEGRFADHVLQKLEAKEVLSLQLAKKRRRRRRSTKIVWCLRLPRRTSSLRLPGGQEELEGEGGTHEEKGQESALEHPSRRNSLKCAQKKP